MRLPATTRAERAGVCWRRTYWSRFVHLATTLLADRTRNGLFDSRRRRNATRQERNTIMEPLMATAAEATDMLRVIRSGVYRLIAAGQPESMNIGRPQRASVASIRHVVSPQCGVVCVARGLAVRS